MEVHINGEPRQIADDTTVARLVEQEGLAGRRIAVEINREIVPRGRFAVRCLQPGDCIEIVHAIGGGQRRGTAPEAASAALCPPRPAR